MLTDTVDHAQAQFSRSLLSPDEPMQCRADTEPAKVSLESASRGTAAAEGHAHVLHLGQLRAEHLPGQHDAAADGGQSAQTHQAGCPYLLIGTPVSAAVRVTPLHCVGGPQRVASITIQAEPRACMLPGPPCGSGAAALCAGTCARPAVRLSAVPWASRTPSAASASNSSSSPSTSYATASTVDRRAPVRGQIIVVLCLFRTDALYVSWVI